MSDVFFSAGDYFSQLYPYKLFLLEISLQDSMTGFAHQKKVCKLG